MAQPAVLGDQDGGVDAVLHTARAHHPEHRHQLLLHQWVGGEFAQVRRQLRQQYFHRGRHAESGPGGQFWRLLPDRIEGDLVATTKRELGHRLRLVGGEQLGPHPLELGDHLVVDLVVDDAGLLGRADDR